MSSTLKQAGEEHVRDIVEETPHTSTNRAHREGTVARSIEQQTAKIPSDVFLWAALGAIGASLGLRLAGRGKAANFVGQWVPTILIFGLYNKLVKLEGSDGA
jgi:hypothetical protein